MEDSVGMECGVFSAIDFERNPIFPHVYWGMRAQNHRGHQSHGFLTFDGKFNIYHSLDLIPKIKRKEIQEWLTRLPGHVGIANVRYTTSGCLDEEALIRGTQPVTVETEKLKLAISFNGNIVNTVRLKKEICKTFPDFTYECDAELICRKLAIELKKGCDLQSAVKTCMEQIEGAFSVSGITQEGDLFAFKDPYGLRPLCSGFNSNGNICAFSSETVGLDINGFNHGFEVEPGEFVTASKGGFEREQLMAKKRRALCAFEFAYFARPDSKLNGKYVYEVREEFGKNLGRENSDIIKDADLILSLPETSNDAAYGLHEETGLRWEKCTRRHRYVTDRAFILLSQERHSTINRKINIVDHKLRGKNLIVVDDSIVRGDTTRVVIEKMRKMGAKKIHLFITFPRIIGPCFYGIDMATYGELIGSTRKPEEIARVVGADSLNYQSIEGFVKATGMRKNELCLGCVTGKYPTPLAQRLAKWMRRRFESGHKEMGRIYEIDVENLV
ncbi:MAG: amidophosphoribosyltransferase [Candidatus Bathyarchaeota archaeon]|nr:amidophosphoribosyltransferase [Candidatus Bathyarchaeota archaeon]MDH5495644.1 amidophosphoribosyltransferase [Candidatus Bathyarchaeota archaeon]